MRVLLWIGLMFFSVSAAQAMTVDQVIELSRRGVDPQAIIAHIDAKRVVFNINPKDLVRLRLAEVDTAVIDHMRDSRFLYRRPSPGASVAQIRRQMRTNAAAEERLNALRGRAQVGKVVGGVGSLALLVGGFALFLQYLNSEEYPQNYQPMALTALLGGAVMVTGIAIRPSADEFREARQPVLDTRRSRGFPQPRTWSVPLAFEF